jgi:hypothetical protein
MTINRTTLLDLPLPVTGTESGTWGNITNNGLSQYVDIAVAGMNALTSSDFTAGALTISNTLGTSAATNIAAGSAQYATIKVSSLATNSTITAPASNRSYRIVNLDSTYNLTIKASGQTGITFLPGQTGVVAFTGTDYEVVGVVNAASSTDNAVPRFDGTTGQIIQTSSVVIDDSGNLTTAGLNTSGAVVFNDAGADVDFRVEGNTDANLLFVDASTDRVGIGTDTPTQTLSLDGYLSVNSNNISADNSLGFRNRIINGDMRIDQRNAGASVTPSNADYTLDRYQSVLSAASKYSIQQVSDAPTGFVNSLRVTSSSAYAVSADEVFQIRQSIEGTNCSDLAFGSASAKTVTLSFWVRSSLTGTFGGRIQNSAGDRNYPFSYTISIADTWEYKTVTIAGDTTGTWLTTTGIGIQIRWSLGSGSDFQGTAGSWTASNISSVTGETQVVATNGATWYVTGVQLEVGSVATPFERRPYGTELSLCQRYYQQLELNATGSADFKYMDAARGAAFNASIVYPVEMRTSPTIAFTGTQTYTNSSGLAAAGTSAYSTRLNVSVTGAGQYRVINGNVTISAEL